MLRPMENVPHLLKGKKGLVMGVANDMSLAWAMAQAAHAAGAELAFTYAIPMLKDRVEPLAASLNADYLVTPCNVQDDASIAEAFSAVEKKLGKLDFVIHAIAFADKNDLRGDFSATSRAGFALALDVSCYSLIAVAKAAKPLLNAGGSIVTLTYLGGPKVVPNYNVMGVAKAALESAVRYLAAEFGPYNGTRVNAISAGPVRTLAASAIGDFKAMLKHHETTSPLRRLTAPEDVAGAALYLLSDLSKGVTGEIHYVDTGASTLGPTPFTAKE